MNAIQLLEADHRTVKHLLSELSETTSRATKKRIDLLRKIQMSLKAHTTIEEEIFYPAFKKAGGKHEAQMYFEALEEHRAAGDLVMPDLMKTNPDSEKFSGRAKVLKELIGHHIKEEEGTMFKEAKKLLSKEELSTLGDLMETRKNEILKSQGK